MCILSMTRGLTTILSSCKTTTQQAWQWNKTWLITAKGVLVSNQHPEIEITRMCIYLAFSWLSKLSQYSLMKWFKWPSKTWNFKDSILFLSVYEKMKRNENVAVFFKLRVSTKPTCWKQATRVSVFFTITQTWMNGAQPLDLSSVWIAAIMREKKQNGVRADESIGTLHPSEQQQAWSHNDCLFPLWQDMK